MKDLLEDVQDSEEKKNVGDIDQVEYRAQLKRYLSDTQD